MLWGTVVFLAYTWCMSIPVIPEDLSPEDVTSDPEAKAKAKENYFNMNSIQCRSPLPKLFAVKDLYPAGSKRYLPHCVMLHRCDNDAGCCEKDDEMCSPATSETVFVYFYVNEFTPSGRKQSVLKMPFLNHTSCKCMPTRDNPR